MTNSIKNYVAVDILIEGDVYKLLRISQAQDESVFITPEIKQFIENTMQSKINDIHISNHASGEKHLRIKGIDITKYGIKQITQVSNTKGNWYFSINIKDKKISDVFKYSRKDPKRYKDYYLMELKTLSSPWFTIFVNTDCKETKKTKLKIIQELSIKVFDSDIRIYVCEGCVERKNKGYNLKFSPSGLKSTTERIPN